MKVFFKLHGRQLIKFLSVGIFNTIFGYALFAVLLFVGLHYSVAAAFSVAGGAAFNFQTIGHFVFKSRHRSRLFKFSLVYFFVYLLKISGLYIFGIFGVNNYLGGAILIFPLGIFSFILNKFWVFGEVHYKKGLAKKLIKIDPNEPLGLELFEAIARLSITVSFEGVLLRENSGKIEIFLTKRDENESAYPSTWHCPGTVFRPRRPLENFNPEEDAANRLAIKEFGVSKFSEYKFIGEIFINEKRGVFNPRIYILRIDEPLVVEPSKSGWFNVDLLPEQIFLPHKEKIIPIAVKYYKTA